MIAYIADLHLGVKLPKIDYLKSLDKFLSLIKDYEEDCDCIMVVGDLFDHKLSVEESKFAALFLVNLVFNNCGRNGRQHVPVHFIHGTYNHDNEQYEIFLPVLEKIPNAEVFYTKDTCVGTLHNGMKVLYLPQMYGDVDYTEAFNDTYDLIVGHGPISSDTNAPCQATQYEILHSAEKLGSISKLCVFGHYHGYTDFGNGVYYAGPWLRWKYGEDTDRVFFFSNNDFTIKTFPNDIAMEFETYPVYSPEELRGFLANEITNPHRFIIHCNSKELNEYHGIMNAYKKNPYIKYQMITTKDEEINEEISVMDEKNVTVVEPIPALIEYVKDKYNIDITEEAKEYETTINRDKRDDE